jgi:S1-C subfamily serine protease
MRILSFGACFLMALSALGQEQLPMDTGGPQIRIFPYTCGAPIVGDLTRPEFIATLMDTVYPIKGSNGMGTAFILGRRRKDQPGVGDFILITARHILDVLPEDVITLLMRLKSGANAWIPMAFPLSIRAEGHPLWVTVPNSDVAVLAVKLPQGFIERLLPIDLLSDSTDLLDLWPGMPVGAMGFPLGVDGPFRFALQRAGSLTTRRVVPSLSEFWVAFPIHRGDSGGPVYTTAKKDGKRYSRIIGLVSGMVVSEPKPQDPTEDWIRVHSVDVAQVAPSNLIRDAITLLSAPASAPSLPGARPCAK